MGWCVKRVSEKRGRRIPTGTRDEARARSTRVFYALPRRRHPVRERHALRRPRRPTHATPIATGVAPTPRASALTAPIRLKKLTAPKTTAESTTPRAARAPGGRGSPLFSAAEGSSKSRKSVHNVTRARHAERLRRKAPARFEDHVPLDLLLRRGGVHSEAHLRRHAWPRHDVRGTRSPRTTARCRGSRPKFDRNRPEARPRGSPSVDLSRRPAPSLLLPRDGASGPPSRAPSADLPSYPPSTPLPRSRRPPGLVSSRPQGAGYTPGCEVNHRRNHPVNVHGCGIGWYARERCGLVDELGLDAYNRPTVYTTVAARATTATCARSRPSPRRCSSGTCAPPGRARACTSTTATRSSRGGTCSCTTATSRISAKSAGGRSTS